MERIKDVSLAQRAADAIKTSIIEGKYNQGEKITQEECAKNLGLSRICVREAFGQLAAEGLLVKEVNRCTRVASFTKREIEDVLRLRVAIERLCIAQCRERKSIPEVSLRQSVERMGELAAKGEGYEREQMREDFAFHAAIVDGAGNTHAAKVWHGIEGQILTMLYPAISEYTKKLGRRYHVREHTALIDALEEESAATLDKMIEEHILESMSTLLEIYS